MLDLKLFSSVLSFLLSYFYIHSSLYMQGLPLTVRRSIELLGVFLLGYLVVTGREILMPLVMAFFIAIVLQPLFRFLRNRRLPEVLSIALSLLALVILVGLLVWFFSAQISRLVADFPQIKENVMLHLNSLSSWINAKTNFSTKNQLDLINEQSARLLNYAGGLMSGTVASITSIFIFIGLLPIYIFLIMYYKNLLLRFVFMWFPQTSHAKLEDAMREVQVIIKSYLVGLLIQITYISFLLGGLLLIFGIKHALLIGVIFAILNLIPYVGALIGNIIGVLLTLTSSQEVWPIFLVLGTIAVVQFLDNNILMPRIVGSKVKINALASIVGVIVGGSLAGVTGMFLSLPIIAVMKIVFDRTDNMKQWGVLLGDEKPKYSPMSFPVFRLKNKKVKEKLEEQNKIEKPFEGTEEEKKDSPGDQNKAENKTDERVK